MGYQGQCCSREREREFDRLPPRERFAVDPFWRVAHAVGSALPGWSERTVGLRVLAFVSRSPAERVPVAGMDGVARQARERLAVDDPDPLGPGTGE